MLSLPVALLLSAPLVAPTPQDPIREGQPLPSLALPTVDDGRLVSLADFRGQKLLLIEFASW